MESVHQYKKNRMETNSKEGQGVFLYKNVWSTYITSSDWDWAWTQYWQIPVTCATGSGGTTNMCDFNF